MALAWWYLAPTNIGGSTRYVVTSGVSMEPRFHSGDLAVVRPENNFRVGQIVAYHSTLLHVTVLHRIIGRDGTRYLLKGDHNDFTDPTHPTRTELLGALWLHVPHGGYVFKVVHSPIAAAILCAALGLLLVSAGHEQERRRRRHASPGSSSRRPKASSMKAAVNQDMPRPIKWSAFLTASAIAGAAFLLIGLFAFTRSAHRSSSVNTPYVHHVTFHYSAPAHASAVYPTGAVHTGDPIFSQLVLVDRLDVRIDYRLTTPAQHTVSGAEEVVLQLTGPGGWSRRSVLVPRTRFAGDHTSTDVMLDLPYFQALFQKVVKMTGVFGDSGYTIAVQPTVH